MELTPKEKAEELFEKYNDYLQQEMQCIVYVNQSKQCALIAQKNLLNKLKELNIVDEFEEEVLFEINAL